MLMDFLTDNSDKIWTLFSVIIGGTVTYISTSSAEKKKNKRQAQKEKLEQVLLPYCTCLELTIHEIDKVYGGNKYLYSGKVLEQWLSNLKKPLEYLAAYKRVYLSKSSREILVQYEKMLSRFGNTRGRFFCVGILTHKNRPLVSYLQRIIKVI